MVFKSDYYRSLNEFYASSSGLTIDRTSFFDASIQALSQFKSDTDIKLPFLIRGRLITAKEYPDKKYGRIKIAPEVLKTTISKFKDINLYTSHAVFDKIIKGEDVSVDEVVGKIVNTSWNEEENGVDFTAEIYDRKIAYKMDAGLINKVSLGFARDIVVIKGEYYFTNIVPVEASLVFDPRDSQAVFSPVEQ